MVHNRGRLLGSQGPVETLTYPRRPPTDGVDTTERLFVLGVGDVLRSTDTRYWSSGRLDSIITNGFYTGAGAFTSTERFNYTDIGYTHSISDPFDDYLEIQYTEVTYDQRSPFPQRILEHGVHYENGELVAADTSFQVIEQRSTQDELVYLLLPQTSAGDDAAFYQRYAIDGELVNMQTFLESSDTTELFVNRYRADDGGDPLYRLYIVTDASTGELTEEEFFYRSRATGVAELPLIGVTLQFPNPISVGASIIAQNVPSGAQFEIYDTQGRLLQTAHLGENETLPWTLPTSGLHVIVVRAPGFAPRAWKAVTVP